MLRDAREIENDKTLVYDLCIVGAGMAGIALAQRFIGDSYRVCVLESGGLTFDRAAQALAGGENVGHGYFPLDETRLRRFGGTAGWWAGECRPLDAETDFAARLWLDHPGWPITGDELAPYYSRAEAACGLGPGQFDPAESWFKAAGCERLDLDTRHFVTRIFKYCRPARFLKVGAANLQSAPNIEIFLNATVTSIATDADGRFVRSVRALSAPERKFAVEAAVVVLAAGGIENARLLLTSTSSDPAGLGNHYDQVGRGFMEHLFFDDVASFEPERLIPSIRLYGRRQSVSGSAIKATLAPSVELMARAGILNCCFKFASPLKRHPGVVAALALGNGLRCGFPPSGRAKQARTFLAELPATIGTLVHTMAHGEYGSLSKPGRLLVSVTSEQAPNPASRVTLSARRDALGQPMARLDWRLSEADHRTWIYGLELLAKEFADRRIGRISGPDGATRERAMERLRGGRHHIGTTRMSEHSRQGVVDRNCQVHGVDNLFIAGSSVFATAGHANPTLTIVALALRLADHLKSARFTRAA